MSKLFWPHCEIGCLKHFGSFIWGSCMDLDEKKEIRHIQKAGVHFHVDPRCGNLQSWFSSDVWV